MRPGGPQPGAPGTNSPIVCDIRGQRLPGISKWAFSYGAEYALPARIDGEDGNAYLGFDFGDLANDSISYRINGRIAGGDTYSDHQDGVRGFIAPSITWVDSTKRRPSRMLANTGARCSSSGGSLTFSQNTAAAAHSANAPATR